MTDNRNESTEADRPVPALPRATLLQLNLRRREGAAAGDEMDSRGSVLASLISKILKLTKAASALDALLFATDDPVEYNAIALQLAEARAEIDRCKARYDAIDAGKPFNDPGPDAETALLNAINQVGAALANTAAVSALLAATHNLVQAYRAQST
jgi:hypothetical protein